MTIEIPQIPQFDINGYYIKGGYKSRHHGRILLYPDGKLSGVIFTYNPDGDENIRWFIGLYDRETASIQFMKIPKPSEGLMPSFYSLTSETLFDGEFPLGGYRGFWVNLKLPIMDPVRKAVSKRDNTVYRELLSLSASELRETSFNPQIVCGIEELGAHFRQKGMLGFKKCGSLAEKVQV